MTSFCAGRTRPAADTPHELVSAMLEPGFYPRRPSHVTHKETHISHVFVTDDLVYKIKKPVRLASVDYSTLSKRRYYLNEELRLNRRLAPSVYLAVMPISLDSGWRLGGWSAPVEYTLIMRRLPERRMLPFLLESGQLTPEMMRSLAESVAPFHTQAETVHKTQAVQYPWTVHKRWAENLSDLEPFLGTLLTDDAFAALKKFGANFIANHHDLFIRRVHEGRIRDLHGDLHGEHICFAPEGIQIFDCVEYSPQLRCSDVAAEIGFLLMDLGSRGAGSLAGSFLDRYLELLSDPDLPRLLPFYQCYGALVRGKIEALRSSGFDGKAARYFRYASRFTSEPLKPFLVIVAGLTGSGKSSLSRALGERLDMEVISSGVVRKTSAGKRGRNVVPVNEGLCNPEMIEKTYTRMMREAEKQILDGRGAILEATFGHKHHRDNAMRLAAKHKVPLLMIHCHASDEITKERLDRRPKDLSDGQWEIYLAQKAAVQPIEEPPANFCLELDTNAPAEQLVRTSETFVRSRLAKM